MFISGGGWASETLAVASESIRGLSASRSSSNSKLSRFSSRGGSSTSQTLLNCSICACSDMPWYGSNEPVPVPSSVFPSLLGTALTRIASITLELSTRVISLAVESGTSTSSCETLVVSSVRARRVSEVWSFVRCADPDSNICWDGISSSSPVTPKEV